MTTVAPRRPSARARHILVVATYNTIPLHEGDVYELRTPFSGPYYYNVLNLGPMTVYIRADHDPERDDPLSETLPPHHADNLIVIPEGREGLRFLAGPPADGDGPHHGTTITLRLVRG